MHWRTRRRRPNETLTTRGAGGTAAQRGGPQEAVQAAQAAFAAAREQVEKAVPLTTLDETQVAAGELDATRWRYEASLRIVRKRADNE